jgi:putative ABC transport system substrate-binding protein
MSDLVGKCDALWIPPDPSLISEDVIKYIGSTSLSKQLPCIGPSERYVRAGAVVSMVVDPLDAGKTAGDVANKILAGTPTSKLPVIEQKKFKIIINTKAAGLLGLTIPKNVQDAASKVYQ